MEEQVHHVETNMVDTNLEDDEAWLHDEEQHETRRGRVSGNKIPRPNMACLMDTTLILA